jgi:hypothetical protein
MRVPSQWHENPRASERTRDPTLERLANRILTVMSMFDQTLTENTTVQNIAFTSLSEHNQQLALQLQAQAARIKKGENLIEHEFQNMEAQIEEVAEEAAIIQAETTRRIAEELKAHKERAERHEAVSSQLHTNIGAADAASYSRDQILEQRVLEMEAQRKEDQKILLAHLSRSEEDFKRYQKVGKQQQEQIAELTKALAKLTKREPSRPNTAVDEKALEEYLRHLWDTNGLPPDQEEGQEELPELPSFN